MSSNDIDAIMRRLDDLASAVEVLTTGVEEVKGEVVAVKAWQTIRDGREHDAAVTREAYGKLFRFAIAASKSPLVPWICAGAGVVWATLR